MSVLVIWETKSTVGAFVAFDNDAARYSPTTTTIITCYAHVQKHVQNMLDLSLDLSVDLCMDLSSGTLFWVIRPQVHLPPENKIYEEKIQ